MVSSLKLPGLGVSITALMAVIAVLAGDAAMVGIAALTKSLVADPLLQWVVATAVIGVGAYFIFGYTQIKAWQKGTASAVEDARSRWAARRLGAGGWLAFVLASIVGGPLAIGWYYGRLRHRRAHQAAMAASVILATVWSAVYLGFLNLAF